MFIMKSACERERENVKQKDRKRQCGTKRYTSGCLFVCSHVFQRWKPVTYWNGNCILLVSLQYIVNHVIQNNNI